MNKLIATLALLSLSGAQLLTAQNTILFSGRFPFVGLDAVNERQGGAINTLEEFDFTYVTPGTGATARSLLPATAMQCYLGDGDNDGNYLKFSGLKTYFQSLSIGGLFVRYADRGNVTWDKVYFTVRDNVTADIEVMTNNGATVHTLVPGDWVRLLPNGNVEFFMKASDLAIAAGLPPTGQGSVDGAHALVQDANGNLYYTPVQGGHWVNGNQNGPVFCNDGAICKIDAANIVYDANGNIQTFVPDSARLLIEEVNVGPGSNPRSIRSMAGAAGAYDNAGNPIVGTSGATVWGKTSGLGIDPNGGTFTPTFPDATGAFPSEPNLVFTTDAGRYAATIFSTANNGSVATINGVLCGSTAGAPATGAWLGVQANPGSFQPTVMGLTLVDALEYEPLLIDQNDFGSLPLASAQATWDIDVHGAPTSLVFLMATFGPGIPGQFVPSMPISGVPISFVDSHADAFIGFTPVVLGFALTDVNGYGTWSYSNPNIGGFSGITMLLQAAAPVGASDVQMSTPTITQLQ